jgi:small subunit ribosomal protein S6
MATRKKTTVKKVDKQTNSYELVFIVSPEATDESLEAIIGNVSQFITSKGGTIASSDKWGKRKFAYPLKHFMEGNYVLSKFEMNPESSHELENHLVINDQILRHLLVLAE